MTERIPPSRALAAAGLVLPNVTAPLAAYTPAGWLGGVAPKPGQLGVIRTSGQLPLVDGQLPACGKVGDFGDGNEGEAGLVSPQQAFECARVAAINALAAAAWLAGDVDRVVCALRMTVFVASAPQFTGQPQVANGASELLGTVFAAAGEDAEGRAYPGEHTRSAVGVAVLPLDAPVELEVEFLARA